MKAIWLGQGGLLIVSGKLKVVIDPYLSNSMRKMDKTMKRRIKVKKKFLRIKPDMIIITNSHPDHADMTTLKKYLHKTRKRTVVLASEKAYDKIYRERIAGRYSNIMFEEGDEWTLKHLLIKGVKCKTDDKSAFSVIIEDSFANKKLYIAGNTLYNKYIIEEFPSDIDYAYIPISGQYSTMNIDDAQRFAREIGAKVVVPFHFGMFDKVNPEDFKVENKIIPKPYRVIPVDAEKPETLNLSPEERLARGLDEKPYKYPKTYKEAVKLEKAEEKAYLMRKQLVDSLQKFVECEDPTMTDASLQIGTASMFPASSIEEIGGVSPDISEQAPSENLSVAETVPAQSFDQNEETEAGVELNAENEQAPIQSQEPELAAEAVSSEEACNEETESSLQDALDQSVTDNETV